MNTSLLLVHWVSMFLALTGGVMLAVWLFKNVKPKNLLALIVAMIVIGLLVSYLTFPYEMQFYSEMFNGNNNGMNGMMHDMMN
ncbi:MAG: hypothetical protein AAB373_00645 [Patescibacteria group bacterium]